MNSQTHCDRYLQNIHRTQTSTEATPELSLYPHLQTFLEELSIYFGRDTITLTQEPRQLEQIGRPDFIAIDGLLPVGYIEAEAYGRDLDTRQHRTLASSKTLITSSSPISSNFGCIGAGYRAQQQTLRIHLKI